MDEEDFKPSLASAREAHRQAFSHSTRPTLLPLSISTSSDFLTPTTTFLKLSNGWVNSFCSPGAGHRKQPLTSWIGRLLTTPFSLRVLLDLPRQLGGTVTLELVSCPYFPGYAAAGF